MSNVLVGCKRLCFSRCIKTMSYCFFMELFLLATFLYLINLNLFHPIEWFVKTYNLVFSPYTWFAAVPLMLSVIVYVILLGKLYLSQKHYYCSRFKGFIGNFVKRTLFFGAHIFIGSLTAYYYIGFLTKEYRDLIYDCFSEKCINNRTLFLISLGIVAAIYYFINESLHHSTNINISIIQENKIAKIRSLLYSTLFGIMFHALILMMIFLFTYALFGNFVCTQISSVLDIKQDASWTSCMSLLIDYPLIFYAWILTSHIMGTMKLMDDMYRLILTEEMNFPITKSQQLLTDKIEVTLTEALGMSQIPVIQNLAALELYQIATEKSGLKRCELFALSIPGNHPYNWNHLSSQCLALIEEFTNDLSMSIENISTIKTSPLFPKPSQSDTTAIAAEKILIRQYNAMFGIRQLAVETTPPLIDKNISVKETINKQIEEYQKELQEILNRLFRTIPGLFYCFGEPEGAKAIYLLSNSYLIGVLCEALTGIAVASLVEDEYGVVQNVLPKIIKAILNLKLTIDKLNNINFNGRKCDQNLISLKGAVKRSLYKICTVFGDYLMELCEEPDDFRILLPFYNYREL